MPILVVLPGKSFLVILARDDRTLLGPLGLMGEHMGFQVLEKATAVGIRATAPFLSVLIEAKTCGSCVLL